MTYGVNVAATPVCEPARATWILTPSVLSQFVIGLVILGLGVAVAVDTAYLAYALVFVMTFGVTLLLPGATPFLLLFAFIFQNTFIAFTSKWVSNTLAFDEMRAINFIMLVAVYSCFAVAGEFSTRQLPARLRPWFKMCWVVLFAVAAYFMLGLAVGFSKDAIIYLRNIVTPIVCFQIALVCGARFKISLVPTLFVTTVAIVLYGYCELIFEMNFLSLFNGDRYLWLTMQTDIIHGVYTRLLHETGFVLRGVEDSMMVPFFNITGAGRHALQIFRLSGPNFHPISYGYAIALLTAWLFTHRIRWPMLFALPIVIFVGSKGATVLLVTFLVMWVAIKVFRPAIALLLLIGALIAYTIGVWTLGIRLGDYHVLGLMAGVRDFLANPLGHGIGQGGNLSTAGLNTDWPKAVASGATDVPVESTVAVLFYQMGIAAILVFRLVLKVAARCWKGFVAYHDPVLLFGCVSLLTIAANAFFQEEAFFAPLALGACMMLVGHHLGALMVAEHGTEFESERSGRASGQYPHGRVREYWNRGSVSSVV